MGRWLWSAAVCCSLSISPGGVGASEDTGIIGFLQMREHKITIRSTPAGIRYSVQSADGRAVAMSLDASQLEARFPRLHQVLDSGVASSIPGAIVWAGQ